MERFIKNVEFTVGDNVPVVLAIYSMNDITPVFYKAVVVSGDTGTGNISGGPSMLNEFIEMCINSHKYNSNFFNKGYAEAKKIHDNSA